MQAAHIFMPNLAHFCHLGIPKFGKLCGLRKLLSCTVRSCGRLAHSCSMCLDLVENAGHETVSIKQPMAHKIAKKCHKPVHAQPCVGW